MSAIGDYIHLTYNGYVKKQGKHSAPYKDSAASAIAQRQSRFEEWLEKQGGTDIKNLEQEMQKDLDMLKGMINRSSSGNQSEYNQAQKQLLEDIMNILPDKYIKFDIVQAAAVGALGKGGAISGSQNIGGQGTATQQAAAARITQQMQEYINNFTDTLYKKLERLNSAKDKTTIVSINSEIKKQTQIFLQKVEGLQKISGKGGGVGAQYLTASGEYKNTINKIYQRIKKTIVEGESQELLNDLATYAKVLKYGVEGTAFIGDVGEAIATAAGIKAGKIANKEVVSAVMEGMLGSARGLYTSNFIPDANYEALINARYQQDKRFGNLYLKTADNVQDKVDVSITLEDGENINLSVKNYSLGKGRKFSFISANALGLIQNENDDNFINHFYNLNGIAGLQNSKDRKDINILMKKILLAKLIAGYNTQTGNGNMKEANYFVVIDNKNYTVKIYSMSKLLKALFNNNKYNKIQLPTNLISANKWQPNISTRLNNIMKTMAFQVNANITENELSKID